MVPRAGSKPSVRARSHSGADYIDYTEAHLNTASARAIGPLSSHPHRRILVQLQRMYFSTSSSCHVHVMTVSVDLAGLHAVLILRRLQGSLR